MIKNRVQMRFRSYALAVVLSLCLLAFASFAYALTTLPAPNEVIDGVPVAMQFDDFYSYPVQLLYQLDPVRFAELNNSAGIGGLDVLILRWAGGQLNNPVSGGFVFEDPVDSAAGSTSTFSGTWGAGLRPHGPVTVDNLLNYLHFTGGPDNNIPVFTFDLNEPGAKKFRDLELVAKFSIWDTLANGGLGGEEKSWAFDAGTIAGVFEANAWVLAEGELVIPGLSKTYTIDTTGSGKNDFAAFSPDMDLTQWATGDGRYQFHIFSQMQLLDSGGEEAWISGDVVAPQVPEPLTLLLVSSGILGLWGYGRKRT